MLSVKAIRRTLLGAGALTFAASAMPGVVQAQTAADINRASAAMQICASPMGAGVPECAQLKQQLGVGSGGGANAGASAAGALLNGLANRGGGGGGLAGILGAVAGQAAQAAAPAGPAAGGGDYYNQAAGATYNAAAGYQACVAANPTNWQSCMAQMNGGAPAAVPGAVAVAPGLNLSGAALTGYQRCLENNPADKCAQAYGAYSAPATAAGAAAPAQGAGNAIATAASAAQTAKQLAPTLKALGSLLGR